MAQARRVNEPHGQAPQLHADLQGVPGGAGDVGDDGAVIARQGVEQRGFARVGTAHDGAGDALGELLAPAAGGQQSAQFFGLLAQYLGQLLHAEGVNVLVRVVQHGVEVGHHVHQSGVDVPNLPGQGSGELAGGVAGALPAFGLQQVPHRLGLGQVQLAIEEGTAGKLSRPGLAGPLGEEGVQPQGQDHRGAVAVKLRRVLPGVAERAPAVGTQHPVNGLPAAVQQVAVDQIAGGMIGQTLGAQGFEAILRHLHGLGAGQAQDPDGAGTRRSGNGGNGISFQG